MRPSEVAAARAAITIVIDDDDVDTGDHDDSETDPEFEPDRGDPVRAWQQRRLAPRWRQARDDVHMVLQQAIIMNGAEITLVEAPVCDASRAVMLGRLTQVLRAVRHRGGRVYVGSTSDPSWRWVGGRGWRSDRGGDEGKFVWMKGHRGSWQYMHVLAAYPDAEAAEAEVICIRHAQALLGDRVSNKCCDARGLAVRAHGYSFLYVCI